MLEPGQPGHNPSDGSNKRKRTQADDNNNRLDDEACDKTRPALCECEP